MLDVLTAIAISSVLYGPANNTDADTTNQPRFLVLLPIEQTDLDAKRVIIDKDNNVLVKIGEAKYLDGDKQQAFVDVRPDTRLFGDIGISGDGGQ